MWPSRPRRNPCGGRKKRAKTDRSDARLQRELLQKGELPESWIPPTEVLEWRERGRLYKNLLDQRTQWVQRIHAELFQHGVASPAGEIRSDKTRALLTGADLDISPAGRQRIAVAYRMIDAIEAEQLPLRKDLVRFGLRQPACRVLVRDHYGIGGMTAVIVWSELGDCRRFSRSMQVVRHARFGPDRRPVRHSPRRRQTVPARAAHPALGALRGGQGLLPSGRPRPRLLRQSQGAHNGKVAALSIARRLARRCYHTLRNLDPDLVYAMA
jgi:transposase